jgi:hypothetical protein
VGQDQRSAHEHERVRYRAHRARRAPEQ